MTEHLVIVQADGALNLYLQCACGWLYRADYAPTPAELWTLEQAHRREVDRPMYTKDQNIVQSPRIDTDTTGG